MKKTIATIHLEFKDDHNDSLDLIELRSCKEKCCERSEYCIGCAKCIISHKKLLKRYCRNKLDYLQLQTVDFKTHFKKTCFNCSCSFHISNYVESHFNLQKMFKVAQNCIACLRIVTTKRSFYHNCNVCNAPFENCRLLVQHRESKHASKKPFQCPICHQSLSNGTALRYHILYKHELPHKCRYCSKRYARKMSLKMHKLSHNDEKPFSCEYCTNKYRIKRYLDIHLLEHTGGEQLKCDICDETFAGQRKLSQHKTVHMEKTFSCKYCAKQYKTKRYLDNHLVGHSGSNDFKCDLCDKTFAKQFLLNQHKRIHMEKSFHCNNCPMKYSTKYNLDNHLLEHAGGKQFKCDVCDKVFAKQRNLNQHKHIHATRSFLCDYCPKQYKTKRSLDIHQFEHTGVKQFKCDYCDKTFANRFLLSQHKPVHMEKSFQCENCPKQYKSKRGFDYHLFGHIGGKRYKCDLCDKTFDKLFKLNRHTC